VNGLAHRPAVVDSSGLSRRQAWAVGLLIAFLFAGQIIPIWHSANATIVAAEQQQAVLQRIAEMDRRCHEHDMSAEEARAVLEPVTVPWSGGLNAWDWLRGSNHPKPHSRDEVRRLLSE